MHYRKRGTGQSRHGKTVHKRKIRRGRNRRQCPRHGKMRGPENIEPVDLVSPGNANPKDARPATGDPGIKSLSLGFGEDFGIVDAPEATVLLGLKKNAVENDRGGNDRTCKGTSSGFIHACQTGYPLPPCLSFKLKHRNGIRRRPCSSRVTWRSYPRGRADSRAWRGGSGRNSRPQYPPDSENEPGKYAPLRRRAKYDER